MENGNALSTTNSIPVGDCGTVTIGSTSGSVVTDSCTGITYFNWPCTWWYQVGHQHSFFVAHKHENSKKVKLFLVCTGCGECRKVEIPL